MAGRRHAITSDIPSGVSFSMYTAYFIIILRAILGIIWGCFLYYFEGQFVSICLRYIFTGWDEIRNGIPASQQTATHGIVGFFVAFLITLPFMLIHTPKIRYLFTAKSVILPLTGLGLVI